MAKAEPKDIASVNPDDVRAYLRTRRGQFDAKKKMAETHGRTKVEFQEHTGLNKTAIGFAERLDRFSPEVRQDVLRSLDKIREAQGPVWGQAETVDMFDESAAKERTPEEQVANFQNARASARRQRAQDNANTPPDAA